MNEKLKRVLSVVVTILIIGGSIYFFEKNIYAAAVVALIWGLYRLLQMLFRDFNTDYALLNLERNCNVVLQFKINIEQVLKHPSLEPLYRKLRGNEALSNLSQQQWVDTILQNYKRKYNKEYAAYELTFHIKNNLVWTDGQINFRDTLYEAFYIPYSLDIEDDDIELNPFINQVEHALEIRLLVINGIVKLQVGRFEKEYSPKVLKDHGYLSEYDVYRTYETITSFPLMYFPRQHYLPVRYLNISYAAAMHHVEFRQLVGEIRDYNVLCTSDRSRTSTWKILERFEKKRDVWLRTEDFQNRNLTPQMDGRDYPGKHDIHYSNKYLSVLVSNYNLDRDRIERHVFPDYHNPF